METRSSRGSHAALMLTWFLTLIISFEFRMVGAQDVISLDVLDKCLMWLDDLESAFNRGGVEGLINESKVTLDSVEVAAKDGDPYPLCLSNITGNEDDWRQMTVLVHPKVETGTTQGELKADNTEEELNDPEQGTIVAMSRMIREANDHVNGGYYTFYYHFNTSEALLNDESWKYSPLGAPRKEYIAFSEEYQSKDNETKILFCGCTLSHFTTISTAEDSAQEQLDVGSEGASNGFICLGFYWALLIALIFFA